MDKLGTKIRTNIDEEVPVVAKDLLPYSPIWGGYNVMLMSSSWGYTLGSNFWTFPYDWRQSNEISGQMLTKFIEKKIQGKWNSADIVCHSMGGFVTRAAYKHGARIKRTVYIASPHFGNPLAYFALNPEISTASAQGFDEFIKKLTVGRELKRSSCPFYLPVSIQDIECFETNVAKVSANQVTTIGEIKPRGQVPIVSQPIVRSIPLSMNKTELFSFALPRDAKVGDRFGSVLGSTPISLLVNRTAALNICYKPYIKAIRFELCL